MLFIGTLGAFISVAAFAILLETPRRYLAHVGLVGAVGAFVYLLSTQLGLNNVTASFLSALTIALISQVLARLVKVPVTVFLIAGILPTVPGAGMYRIVHYSLNGDGALSSYYLTETLKIAGVIALGIFLADTLFHLFSGRTNHRKAAEH